MLVITNYHGDDQGGQAMLILDTEDRQTYCMHEFSPRVRRKQTAAESSAAQSAVLLSFF